MEQPNISDMLTAAGIQDSLLQSYRQISLTFQGLLFAGGTVLLTLVFGTTERPVAWTGTIVLGVVVALALITLFVMTEVVRSRGNDVTHWHRCIVKAEQHLPSGKRTFTQFKRAQHERRGISSLSAVPSDQVLSEEQIDELFDLNLAHTRRAVDRVVVYGIAFMWLTLMGSAFWFLRYRGFVPCWI